VRQAANQDLLQMTPQHASPGKKSKSASSVKARAAKANAGSTVKAQPDFTTVEELRQREQPQTIDVVYTEEEKGAESEPRFGSWDESATVGDIEAHLISSQRKFVKYRLNIFYLNKCALKIQHSYFKSK